jgi:hypothetical protein
MNTYHAAINLNLATRRIRFFMGHSLKSYAIDALRSIDSVNPTVQECQNKLEAVEGYLATAPEISNRFEEVRDGSGCTGRMFLNAAKQALLA